MANFTIDLHVHTSNVSSCGRLEASELAGLYRSHGYDGIVITDHYYDGFFEPLTRLSWNEKIDRFLEGYRIAAAAGRRVGLAVWPGMEIRFTENPNDYLIYGITPEFLREHPELFRLGLKRFRALAAAANCLIYQAHPFRPGIRPADPKLLDGVEVINGNPRHDSRNHLARQFAVRHGLRMISGSDCHQSEDLGNGGVITAEPIRSEAELVERLRQDQWLRLIGR
jgi:predicted metal-dependent phosphoesterase TrpH